MELDPGALAGLTSMGTAAMLYLILGILVGHIFHIVKKKTEEVPGESEVSIFYRYIIARPFTTLGAVIGSFAASMALFSQISGAPIPGLLIAGALAGFAADSGINRQG